MTVKAMEVELVFCAMNTDSKKRVTVGCAFAGELRRALKDMELSDLSLSAARGLGTLSLPGVEVDFVAFGIGEVAARRGLSEVLRHRKPSRVILLGIAGGLDPELSSGDLVLGESVVRSDGKGEIKLGTGFGSALIERLKGRIKTVSGSVCCSGNRIICSSQEKAALNSSTGAVCVDMETWAVAEGCAALRIPLTVVRAIADPAVEDLPDLNRFFDPEKGMAMAKLAAYMAFRPSTAVRLKRSSKSAFSSLETVVREIIAMYKAYKSF